MSLGDRIFLNISLIIICFLLILISIRSRELLKQRDIQNKIIATQKRTMDIQEETINLYKSMDKNVDVSKLITSKGLEVGLYYIAPDTVSMEEAIKELHGHEGYLIWHGTFLKFEPGDGKTMVNNVIVLSNNIHGIKINKEVK